MSEPSYGRLSALPLTVEKCDVAAREQNSNAWTRRTTVVRLLGLGQVGAGEDVNYDSDEQLRFQATWQKAVPDALQSQLPIRSTLGGFLQALNRVALFDGVEGRTDMRMYRRWAFESAALALALQQSETSLSEVLGRESKPVRFARSMGLAKTDPIGALRTWLDAEPELRFKLDYSEHWDDQVVAQLSDLGVVDVVDLKGLYRGSFQGPPASREGYERVVQGLPDVWIEDPEINEETAAVLMPAIDRITWDANLHSVQDLWQVQTEPKVVNIKPSRFGTLESLLAVYDYCEARGIRCYGGGQFELDVGRRHIQALASLFHPDMPNDVAPVDYHLSKPAAGLPRSPLPVEDCFAGTGF
ncbi:MAG: hypothetical protein AAF196_14080 [Planctomycetota bacterium]